jgi:aspartyl-tRNA(Asn)/glutamyl-tRNA(Gln) amidotransferase subunit A
MRSYPSSIEKAAYKIKTGKLSPVELTQAYLARAKESQPKFNAFVLITAKSALREAKTAEREILDGRYRGPLHGIPVAVKDLCDMKGLPTTASSKVRRGHRARAD